MQAVEVAKVASVSVIFLTIAKLYKGSVLDFLVEVGLDKLGIQFICKIDKRNLVNPFIVVEIELSNILQLL